LDLVDGVIQSGIGLLLSILKKQLYFNRKYENSRKQPTFTKSRFEGH
jgi:hypothetical protein